MTKTDRFAALERIRHLEEQLARLPVTGDRYRQCATAIRIAVELYVKSLAIEEACRHRDAVSILRTEDGPRPKA